MLGNSTSPGLLNPSRDGHCGTSQSLITLPIRNFFPNIQSKPFLGQLRSSNTIFSLYPPEGKIPYFKFPEGIQINLRSCPWVGDCQELKRSGWNSTFPVFPAGMFLSGSLLLSLSFPDSVGSPENLLTLSGHVQSRPLHSLPVLKEEDEMVLQGI